MKISASTFLSYSNLLEMNQRLSSGGMGAFDWKVAGRIGGDVIFTKLQALSTREEDEALFTLKPSRYSRTGSLYT